MPPIRSLSSQVNSQTNKPLSVSSTITKIESITTTKTNGNTADDILMEEMLLEEQEQCPVKSIDLDSLTIPESSNQKSTVKDEPTKTIPTSVSTPTPSQTKKPYTLYKVQHVNHMTPPLSSRHKKPATKESTTTRK